MIIKVLVENTSTSEALLCEHGLSLFIETNKHKLLFDTGASPLFAENATKMKVDLEAVDLAVISHGHYDHGGGLKAFFEINHKARVYLNEKAFEKHYSNKKNGEKKYKGLDQSLLKNDQFVFIKDHLNIDDELELFSKVTGHKLWPRSNQNLFKAVGPLMVADDFSHEQNLIIKEDKKSVLVAGCAHKGIVNILDQFYLDKGYFPSHVIGGFHLYNKSADKNEDAESIKKIGEYLKSTGAMFYTGHCTGLKVYDQLKSSLGNQLEAISTGVKLNI